MKVLMVARSDIQGGAARASYRLHCALRANGHESRMSVAIKLSSDESVVGPDGMLARGWGVVRSGLASLVMRLQHAPDRNWHSLAFFRACSCPVVAFATAGLPDAVEHGVTGHFAEPFVSADLARGISWAFADRQRHLQLRAQARERAARLWSQAVVTRRYVELYAAVIDAHRAEAVA